MRLARGLLHKIVHEANHRLRLVACAEFVVTGDRLDCRRLLKILACAVGSLDDADDVAPARNTDIHLLAGRASNLLDASKVVGILHDERDHAVQIEQREHDVPTGEFFGDDAGIAKTRNEIAQIAELNACADGANGGEVGIRQQALFSQRGFEVVPVGLSLLFGLLDFRRRKDALCQQQISQFIRNNRAHCAESSGAGDPVSPMTRLSSVFSASPPGWTNWSPTV